MGEVFAVVEVSGGVAEQTWGGPFVNVVIVDWDSAKDSTEDALTYLTSLEEVLDKADDDALREDMHDVLHNLRNYAARQQLTLERLLERGIGQVVFWKRDDGEVWKMTAIANGGILGHPDRVSLVKFGTVGEGIYITDLDKLYEPSPDDTQVDHKWKERTGL